MKIIIIVAIILISLSLQANGQQSQDTLFLKNGDKAVGKLLGQSMTEYRFRSSDGIDFTFSRDEVEKIVTTPEMKMRKVNPDTLSVDLLNLYRHKAVKMRNTGRTLTLSGIGVLVTSLVSGIILMNTTDGEPGEDMNYLLPGFYVICLGGLVGIPCTSAGIPLWAVGGNRKAKAEIALQKFNIAPIGSMAIGLGITIKFQY
jgi:hypothetical protein